MIDVALKEWSCVCDLITEGQFALLLRKGGILEDEGPGSFRLEHKRFALFPSWLHQRPHLLKDELADRAKDHGDEPNELTIKAYAQAPHIWEVPSRKAFDKLDDLHPYAPEQIDMRFDYKPEKPLYLVALRAYRLAEPRTIPNRTEYGGCRSWVPLHDEDHVDPTDAVATMEDAAFSALMLRVEKALE